MKAKSIKGTSAAEIQTALQECTRDGFKPTLAIVFISVNQDRKAVVNLLVKQNIDVIGATSSREFVNGHQREEVIVICND